MEPTQFTTDRSVRLGIMPSVTYLKVGSIIRGGVPRGWHATWVSESGGTWQLTNSTGSLLLYLSITGPDGQPIHSDRVVNPGRYGFAGSVKSATEMLGIAGRFIDSAPELPSGLTLACSTPASQAG